MKHFFVVCVGLLLAAAASAQRSGSDGRFITYIPAESATSTPGIEYRDDNVKAGRIHVSPELLAGLPFDTMMEEKRGAFMHTVPAIRAEVSTGDATYELAAYYHGAEMSFQSAIPAYKERQAVMEAVDTAITGGVPVSITVVSLQSDASVRLHDGAFVSQ